jgi:hypothetical protein
MIIIVAPCRDYMAGMAQTVEQMFVEAFIAQAAIKALHKAILHGLAGRDGSISVEAKRPLSV